MSKKLLKNRSSLSEAFCEKGILKNFQENTCARVSFLVKFHVKDCSFIKKRFQHRCFSVKYAPFILQNISGGIKNSQTKSFVANNLLLYNWLTT